MLLTQDLPKELVESHYPSTEQLPDYFTNAAYVRFTPETDCLALPGTASTVLQLARAAGMCPVLSGSPSTTC